MSLAQKSETDQSTVDCDNENTTSPKGTPGAAGFRTETDVKAKTQTCDPAALRNICIHVSPPGQKRQGFQRAAVFIPNLLPQHPFDEVLPGILLGDQFLGREPQRLVREGVTHVLNAAMGRKFGSVDTDASLFEPLGVRFMGVPANDNQGYNLAAHFDASNKFISAALEENENNKIYIHCVQGISRSATILAAFLMTNKGLSAVEALTTIRKKREIFPNEGFLKQLCALDEELRKN